MAVFNREDGQLALGSKTPVSILQEMLQKRGCTPHYELIYNGAGTQDPRFKFRVSAQEMTAIGDGKTKKEAKHDAAATFLKRLLENVETKTTELKEEVNIFSPYTGALKVNYVGNLDDVCFLNKIPSPNYVLVKEEGPPHAKVFTMRCDLSSISEIAAARTKKQAKHLVAQKMIDRVSKILKDRFIPIMDSSEAPEEIVTDQDKIRNGTFHHDLSHRLQDLHNVFHMHKDELPLPGIFLELPKKTEDFFEVMNNPVEYLEEIVEALEGVVKKNRLSREEFEKAREELLAFFDDEFDCYMDELENEDGDQFENTDEPSVLNEVSFDNILPDFPLSDDEEEKGVETSIKELKEVENIEDFLETSDGVFVFIKVETPKCFWDFIGNGRSDQEALDKAARRALMFLRTLAIPPPCGFHKAE